jgi:RNA polymerase sigma factor (sigma-70 family)
LTAVPDADLLQRFARTQDHRAFREVVRRHGGMVLGTCRRVLGHRQDAEDAFQATFLVLARRAGAILWRESAGPWLHATACRVSLRLRRRRTTRDRTARAGATPSAAPSASASAAWRELCAVLDGELARLPAHYRAPLVLCYLEGNTVDQAAAALRCPRGTVASRLVRARQLLRRRLARRGIGADAPALVALPAVLADVHVPGPLSTAAVRASLPAAADAARRPWIAKTSVKGWDLLMRLFALAPKPLAAAAVTFVAVVTTSLAVLVADSDPPDLRAAKGAWAAAQASVKSLHVQYDRTLEPRADPMLLAAWGSAGGPVDDEYELAFSGDRRYIRRARRKVKLFDGSSMGPEAAAVWFDGRRSWMKQCDYALTLADTKAGEVPITFPRSWFQPLQQHYWCATGFCPPNSAEQKPSTAHEFWRLPDALEWGEYRVVGEEAVDGAACAVFEARLDRRAGMPVAPRPPARGGGAAAEDPADAQISDKLWLDRARGWAARRREVRDAAGNLLLRTSNSAFKEVSPKLWLPMECAEDYFPPPQATPEQRAKPAFTIRMKVTKVSVNQLDAEFFNGAGK